MSEEEMYALLAGLILGAAFVLLLWNAVEGLWS